MSVQGAWFVLVASFLVTAAASVAGERTSHPWAFLAFTLVVVAAISFAAAHWLPPNDRRPEITHPNRVSGVFVFGLLAASRLAKTDFADRPACLEALGFLAAVAGTVVAVNLLIERARSNDP